MCFFDRQGIPEDLLYGYHSPAKDGDTEDVDTDDENTKNVDTENNNAFNDDLDTLRDYSFVTVTKDVNMFEMHSLVQLATRKWLESQDQLIKWREQFISNLCAKLPDKEYKNWERCQLLFPHAKVAMTQRPQSRKSLEEWARMLYNAGLYALQRGRLDEAEEISVLSKNIRSDVLGKEHADTLNSMELVGMVIDEKGKYKDSEVIYRQILATRENVLGRDH
ncbi:hypothetical protein B5807_11151 [Epicoccum nigrum]|uniref:Kinesin light chain n=1 Tax=Epicoccum nigrum TaxID=105696 RepID=A0A1Y2LKK1_EPING|nr:hypothetical protein B5807_11151 [Epicoccum nigrum]